MGFETPDTIETALARARLFLNEASVGSEVQIPWENNSEQQVELGNRNMYGALCKTVLAVVGNDRSRLGKVLTELAVFAEDNGWKRSDGKDESGKSITTLIKEK